MKTPYKPIFKEIEDAEINFLKVLDDFDSVQVNALSEPGSWSAAQVAVHITKSTGSIAKALGAPGKKADRQADELVPRLKAMFLNFETKMNAPEFTLPTVQNYLKHEVITEVQSAYKQALNAGNQADLTELFSIPGLGELTKFELLNFILVHTQRHTHQLEKIAAKVLH